MNRQSRALSLILPLLACLAARLIFAGSSQIPAGWDGSSCDLGDPKIMMEIKEKISSMHAELEAELDCTHPPGVPVEDYSPNSCMVKLPGFCGFYKVTLTLQAKVPAYFHAERLDALGFFSFKNGRGRAVHRPPKEGDIMVEGYDGGTCDLQDVEEKVTLFVSGGLKVILSTGGPLWYPLAKVTAKVTNVEVKPVILCRDGMAAAGGFSADCARFHADLGSNAHGQSAGSVSFEFNEPDALAFSRSGLSVGWNPSDSDNRLIFEDATGRIVEWIATGGIYQALDDLDDDPLGPYVPRRLTMNSCVVDLVDIADGYEIRYYFPEQQPVSNSPLPALSGEPFRVWRVRNPSADPLDLDRIEVTEIVGGATFSASTLEYDSTTGDWTRVSETGAEQVRETVGARAENGDTARFREYADASGNVALRRENLCHEFAWGSEIVEERVGTANPRVTVHEYYDDEDHDGDNYGLLKLTVRPDGSWIRFTYDGEGRVLTKATPWLDAAPDAPDAQCRVVSYTYSDSFPQTTAVTRVLGVEVERTYTGIFDDEEEDFIETHVIQAAGAGAAWNASENLATVTRTLVDFDSPFLGMTILNLNPDETGFFRTIVHSNGQYTVTTHEGKFQNPWSSWAVVSGTRTVEVCDSTGRPLSREVHDIESNVLLHSSVFRYDEFGRQTMAEYDDGTAELTEYGCCGPVREVGRDGSETLTGYDAAKRVSFRTADGRTTFLSYDAAGNTIRETLRGALGGTLTTSHEYDEYGERSATVSPGGLRTEHSSGMQNGRWTETTVYPNGGTEVTAHYRDGGVYTVSGTAVTAIRHLHSIVDGLRVTRTIWPDALGGEAEWEETTRDFLGRPVRTDYPDGTFALREYDAQGRVAREVSPGGRVTLYGYGHASYGDVAAIDMDSDGVIDYAGPDLVQASRTSYALLDGTRPVRRVQSWGFTGSNATPQLLSQADTAVDGLLSVREERGLATRDEIFFRSRGRVLRTVTAPDGNTAEQEWLHGSLRRSVSELGGTVEYFPDQFSRQVRVQTTRNGATTLAVTTLNADGRAVAMTLTAGGSQRTTRREFDEAGNVVKTVNPDGTIVQYEYDRRGNLTLECGDTYRVAYAYDHRNRLVAMTTWRTPDGSGPGDTTTWAYDARGRMVRKTYADGSHVDYAYDADGNVLTRISARGVVASFAYDAASRLVSISFSDGTPSISYTYDRASRLVSVTDAAGTRALAYDDFGNCLSETVPHVAGKTITRTFDALNRRTGLSIDINYSIAYSYDNFSRLSAISSGANAIAFGYRAHGTALAEKRWLRNDAAVASAAAQYDAWDNISAISFGAPGDLHSLGYIYDIANRRTQMNLPDGTKWLYGYDRLSQVTSGDRVDAQDAPVSGGSFRYAYDGIGNRTSAQEGSSANLRRYVSNALNQYITVFSPGVIPIRGRADADARVAVTTTVGGVSTTYLPDRSGQDFSIDIPVDNSQGAVTAQVIVDALRHDGTLDIDLHRRLSGDYTVPAATPEQPTYDLDGNLLSHDGWACAWNAQDRLVSATKGDVRLEFNYDYLGRRFEKKVYESNALVKHQLFVYDGFKQIAEYDALDSNALANTYVWQPVGLDVPLLHNGSEFCVSDANKNIVVLIDTTGSVTDTYIYDPFGNCTHSGTSANPFRFSSEYFDAETGLVYYNYRYYSPELGRWLSRDPVGMRGGLNLYGNLNDFCNRYDKYGLLLVAVDGTDSEKYMSAPGAVSPTGRYRSHVKNFFSDYQNHLKKYYNGPNWTYTGWDSFPIHRSAYEYICKNWCKKQNEPIDLVGHSRGGFIVLTLAWSLKQRGCCCNGKRHRPVPVRFLGMYDAVDMAFGYGFSERVPPNVQNVFHALSHPALRSRWYFNRAHGGVVDTEKTNYKEEMYWGTHSASGGDPWNGDHPSDASLEEDINAAIQADIDMRKFAKDVGVPISVTADNDYPY